MKKLTVHQFDPVIYPRKIWIVKGNITEDWLNERFTDIYDSGNVLQLHDTASASVFFSPLEYKPTGYIGFLICIQGKIGVKDIAHEAVHAATFLFKDIGAHLEPDNSEPFAYLTGWIADCMDQVNRNKFKE